MKITGRTIGILKDAVTGEETVAFDETNHIQDQKILDMCASFNGAFMGDNIGIIYGGNPVSQRRDWARMPENATIGAAISGVTSPQYTWYEPIDDVHVKQLAKRFPAPAEDITIKTIIVTSSTLARAEVEAAVTLTVPCIQTTTQTLDVFYRIQIAYDDNYWNSDISPDSVVPNPYELYEWGSYFLGSGVVPLQLGAHNSNWADKVNPRLLKPGLDRYATINPSYTYPPVDQDYFRATMKFDFEISDEIGRCIGLTAFGNQYDVYALHTQHILKGLDESPIQNIFGHSAAATVPFYDSGTSQGGLGTLVINGDSWTNPDYPKMLRLDIKATGALGVSTYKFRMRNVFGFNSNTYKNVSQEVLGYAYNNNHFNDDFPIIRSNPEIISDANEDKKCSAVLKYDEQTIVAGWINDILISDVPSQVGKRFASDTVPAMAAVDISQFCKDESTGDVYVACRTNGVFRISADQLTVDRSYSATTGLTGVTGCYGISVTTSGRVWAYFGGAASIFGLYYSDDSGASWTKPTFSHASIDAEPTKVVQIFADPSHADDQLAVVYVSDYAATSANQRDIYIAWWDRTNVVATGGTAVQGPLINVIADYLGAINSIQQNSGLWVDYAIPASYMNQLSCSPNDGFWFNVYYRTAISQTNRPGAKFTFGALTVESIASTDLDAYSCLNGGWGVDDTGADAYFYMTMEYENDNTGWTADSGLLCMVRSDLTYEYCMFEDPDNSYFNYGRFPSVYLGAGVHLCFAPSAWTTGTLPHDQVGGVGITVTYPIDDVELTTIGVFDNEVFPEYGWNGSAWEKGHAGTKPTHGAVEALIDGITISFDDAAGTTQFEITDFYTTFAFNGIVSDASTTYEQVLDRYQKPAEYITDLEASVLPGTTRVPGYLEMNRQQATDWQDEVRVSVSDGAIYKTTGGTIDVWDSGARSLAPAIRGLTSNLSSVTRLPNNDMTGVHGYIEWNCYSDGQMATQVYQHIGGLVNSTRLGQGLDRSAIMYGIEIDGGVPDGSSLVTIRVLESGVVKATFDDALIYGSYADLDRARIILRSDGSMVYEISVLNVGWLQLYESPPGTVTIEDLYFEYLGAGYSSGFRHVQFYDHLPTADYYLFLGNGVDSGLFNPLFRTADPTKMVVVIDSLPAVSVGEYDVDTVLATGEYSLFPEGGVIRYSNLDIGKTITANFIYLSDEF